MQAKNTRVISHPNHRHHLFPFVFFFFLFIFFSSEFDFRKVLLSVSLLKKHYILSRFFSNTCTVSREMFPSSHLEGSRTTFDFGISVGFSLEGWTQRGVPPPAWDLTRMTANRQSSFSLTKENRVSESLVPHVHLARDSPSVHLFVSFASSASKEQRLMIIVSLLYTFSHTRIPTFIKRKGL